MSSSITPDQVHYLGGYAVARELHARWTGEGVGLDLTVEGKEIFDDAVTAAEVMRVDDSGYYTTRYTLHDAGFRWYSLRGDLFIERAIVRDDAMYRNSGRKVWVEVARLSLEQTSLDLAATFIATIVEAA